jgi:hypothetical protein
MSKNACNCPIWLPMEGLSFLTRSFSGRRILECVKMILGAPGEVLNLGQSER